MNNIDDVSIADQSLIEWKKGNKPTYQDGQNNGQSSESSITEVASELSRSRVLSAYMRTEERLAKDIYLVLNNIYPAKQY